MAVGYADCGTYGALDALCEELRPAPPARPALLRPVRRRGDRLAAELFEAEPGTYLLTDFLVRSFERTVVRELGLDRWPELRDDYFAHYTRVVWLAQEPTTPSSARCAQQAADRLGLPLTVVTHRHAASQDYTLEDLLR